MLMLNRLMLLVTIAVPLWLQAADGAHSSTAVETNNEDERQQPELEVIQVLARKPGGLELSTTQILQVAGSGNDPLRALEALPGVVLATSGSGGPVAMPAVRGSSPLDNQYQLDDLPVGYVFHNDGLSTLNPLLISSFRLQSNSWQPQYQDATGAVIATRLRDPSLLQQQLVLDAGAIRSAILAETPLGEHAAVYLSARRSFVHLYIDQFIEDEEFSFAVPPKNNDYQSKLVWDIDADNQLRMLATGAADKVSRRYDAGSRDVAKDPDLASGDSYQQRFNQFGVQWDHRSTDSDSSMAFNQLQRTEQLYNGVAWRMDSHIDEQLVNVSHNATVEPGEWQADLQWRQQQIHWQASGRDQPCQPALETCPPGSFAPIRQELQALDVRFFAAGLNWQQVWHEDWQYRLGAALSHNDFSEEWLTEPRLALQWRGVPNWQFELSAGQHHQWFRRLELISAVFGNPAAKQERSRQWGLSVQHQLAPLWSWQLEFYQKTMHKLLVSNPARQSARDGSVLALHTPAYLNSGSGKATGVELLLNRHPEQSWHGWLSLSYARTRRLNELTGEAFFTEWDLPFIANAVLNYQWDSHWQLGLKWRYQGGRRYTGIFGATPVFPWLTCRLGPIRPPLFYDPNEGPINGERRNPLHRLDVRLDYRTTWGPYPVTMYLEVLNLYGHKTVQEQEWNADYSSFDNDYEFPDFPFPGLGISISF